MVAAAKTSINTQFQKSAGAGPYTAKANIALLKMVIDRIEGQGDGRISMDDAHAIADFVARDGKYAGTEKAMVQNIMSAADDRKAINFSFGGKTYSYDVTEPAEKIFESRMASFWGKLGAQAAKKGNAKFKQSATDAPGMKGDQSATASGQLRQKNGAAQLENISYIPKQLLQIFGGDATVGAVRAAFGGTSLSKIVHMTNAERAAVLGVQQGNAAVQAVQIGASQAV